jgi:hypothetical protein
VVTERTIQRDLQQFSTPFQLYCDERSKPYGWCWSKEARRFDLPCMMLNEALAWGLLEQHLQLRPISRKIREEVELLRNWRGSA